MAPSYADSSFPWQCKLFLRKSFAERKLSTFTNVNVVENVIWQFTWWIKPLDSCVSYCGSLSNREAFEIWKKSSGWTRIVARHLTPSLSRRWNLKLWPFRIKAVEHAVFSSDNIWDVSCKKRPSLFTLRLKLWRFKWKLLNSSFIYYRLFRLLCCRRKY